MEDRQVCLPRNLSVDFVGSIGTKQDCLSSTSTQPNRCLCEEGSDFIPLPLRLELANSLLVHVVDNQGRVRVVAIRVVYGLVDVPVVANRGIPGSASIRPTVFISEAGGS